MSLVSLATGLCAGAFDHPADGVSLFHRSTVGGDNVQTKTERRLLGGKYQYKQCRCKQREMARVCVLF